MTCTVQQNPSQTSPPGFGYPLEELGVRLISSFIRTNR